MLNYIWAGLIGLSLFFALTTDTIDLVKNTYQNGKEWEITLRKPESNGTKPNQKIWLILSKSDSLLVSLKANHQELTITSLEQVPAHWKTVHELSKKSDSEPLRARISKWDEGSGAATILLPEVKFVKMRAIAKAAFDMAEFSVRLAIGLIGTMALWLGLMQIAEKSGLIFIVVKIVEPVMRFLFPNVPKGHPAMGAISLNLAANMLGLGNAATPLGIKAMEELQKLNSKKDTATDAMCMFLTINTASVQLVPPVTLVALMGIGVSEMIFSIFFATVISLSVGIMAAKWFAKRHPEKNISVILPEEN
jgi:spore maturation protein A